MLIDDSADSLSLSLELLKITNCVLLGSFEPPSLCLVIACEEIVDPTSLVDL
jgi:hypothetical protein